MRRTLLLIAITTVPGCWLTGQIGLAGTLEIRRTVDLPSDTWAATGLTWDGEYLWTSIFSNLTNWIPGSNSDRTIRVDPSNGRVVSSFSFGDEAGMNRSGTVWDGNYLWMANCELYHDYSVPGSPPDTIEDYLFKLQPDGRVVATNAPPHAPDARTSGGTWDGEFLWFADEKHQEIMQVDPADLSVISSFPSPGSDPLGLAWDGDSFWSIDGDSGLIYQLDRSGNVLDQWTSPTPSPYSIAFDGEFFWILDNDWKRIVQVTAIPEPTTFVLLALGAITLVLIAAGRGRKRGAVGGMEALETRVLSPVLTFFSCRKGNPLMFIGTPPFCQGNENMKTKLVFVIVIALTGSCLSTKDSLGDELRIVHSIDMPSPSGFRHDIAWGEEDLWTLSVDFGGSPEPDEFARLHQLRPSDGSVVSTFTLGLYNHDGLVWDGANLWIGNTNLVAGTGTYGSPPDTLVDSIEVFSADGALVGSFSAPHSPDAVTQGIAWDGDHLWLSDKKHREIMEVDRSDGRIISTFPSPGTEPDSLAWDGSSLWNLDLTDQVIYQLDSLGELLHTWSIPVRDPAGLTFDGQYLWVLDADTDRAFQLAIPEPSTSSLLAVGAILLLLTLNRQRAVQLRIR